MEIKIKKFTKPSPKALSAFIERVFAEVVAQDYSPEGQAEFKKYIDPEKITERLTNHHFILTAFHENELVGLIEIRNFNHVSLLFVRTNRQGKGIGKSLFREALKKCLEKNPELKKITVNASPVSIAAYEKMGFQVAEREKVHNGLRYTPMEFLIQ